MRTNPANSYGETGKSDHVNRNGEVGMDVVVAGEDCAHDKYEDMNLDAN